jgi:F-type H+-transporting ATPase subunit alpha
MEQQACLIFAGTRGFIDKLPIEALRRYEDELLAFLASKHPAILRDIAGGKHFEKKVKDPETGKERTAASETADALTAALADFGKEFVAETKETAA